MKLTCDEERINKELWETTMHRILEPPPERKVWSPNSPLAIVIVEPRPHPWLRACLYNIAHVYGGEGVSLYVYHGNTNKDMVFDIMATWSGVRIVNMQIDNLNTAQYNTLLCNVEFWNMFESEHVLVVQTDCLIRKKIEHVFFQYDYVGAPWPFLVSHKIGSSHSVGNGGFSLRRVSTMRNIASLCTRHPLVNEDVFFRENLSELCVPTTEEAKGFSVEHMFHPDPCGMHQSWRFHEREILEELLKGIPGLM